jgi:hypothetical protein
MPQVSCNLQLRRATCFIAIGKQLAPMFLAIFFPTYTFPTYLSFLDLWQLTREIRDYRRRQRKMGPVYLKYTVESALRIQMCQRMVFSWVFLTWKFISTFVTCKGRRSWRNFHFCLVFFVHITKDAHSLHINSLWTLDIYCCMNSELRYVIRQ